MSLFFFRFHFQGLKRRLRVASRLACLLTSTAPLEPPPPLLAPCGSRELEPSEPVLMLLFPHLGPVHTTKQRRDARCRQLGQNSRTYYPAGQEQICTKGTRTRKKKKASLQIKLCGLTSARCRAGYEAHCSGLQINFEHTKVSECTLE